MPELQLRLLGGFELRAAGGTPVALPPKKARALLAYLALAEGRPQPRDRLASLLWEDADESQARTSLRQALAAIRKALSAADPDILEAGSETVRLDVDRMHVDAIEFARQVQAAQTAPGDSVPGQYEGALLDGLDVRAPVFEDWVRAERERLRNLAADALARQLAGHVRSGRHGEALAAATQLLALDALREDVHRDAMRIYVAQGRHGAALEQYRRCREVLRLELGVPPEPETERLYREILQHRHGAAAGTPQPEPEAAPEAGPAQVAARAVDAPLLRHATVFLIDIAGFTAFAGSADPEDLHDFLLRYRELVRARVRQYGGSVTNYIGSRLMAVFGVPVAHGDDAERAILAAMAIRDSVPKMQNAAGRQLQAQIGVAGGRVLASQDIGGLTLTGGPVSIAARIMEACSAGEIRVSGDVREGVGERLKAQLLQGVTVTGIEQAPPIWRVEAIGRGLDASGERPFVGREVELRQLAGMLESCRSSNAGRVVLVRGEPGIGKSRLMEQFAIQAKAEGFDPRIGQVIEFGGDPLSMLVRNLIGAGAGAQPEQLVQALEKAPVTAELRRFLADMTGGQLPGLPRVGEDDADGSRRQAGRQSALKELVRSLAARQPLLIVVEDIHSATPLTLESLAWIASTTRSSPTLLALTTRTQGDPITPAWRNACGCALTTIDLGPLAEAEALRMAAHYPSPDEGFARACARRSEGNPLFLDQLMRAGQGSGAVPGSLQNLILARLDRLEEKERQALQVAAVLGQRFPRTALQHLLGEPAYGMDRVRDEGLVRDEGEDLAFSHALIQEAVYGSLLRGRRLELHTAAARWYEGRDAVLRARHLGTAGDAGAFDAFMEAARLEAGAYRIEHALELIGRALAFATTDRQRCDLILMRGEFQRDHGQTAKSVQSFGEGLHLAQEDAQRLRAWIGIASGLRTLDLYERALAALDNAQRFAHALGDRKALMNIQSLRGHVYFPLGNMDACLGAHEEARRLATEVGTPADEARALGGLGDAYYQNARILTSRVYVERCIALSRQHGLTRIEINHLPMLGIVRLYCNEIDDGLAACAEALAMARRIGDVRSEVLARLVMGSLHQSAGRNEDCLSECERARELSRPLGAARFEADALTGLGLSCHFLGRAAEARRYLDQAHAMVEQTGPTYTGPWVLAAIALATDDEDVRRKALARGEAQLALGCVSHNYFHFYQIAIEVAREMGQREEMLRYADALERYTAQEPLPWTGFVIARGRALARCLGNDRSAGLKTELRALRESADRIGLRMALPGIDDALAAF